MPRAGVWFIAAIASFHVANAATAQTNLNLEQVHVIRELLEESKADTVVLPQGVAVGDVLPQGIQSVPMPAEIAAKLPQIKAHFLVLSARQIIILDAQREKIAEIIDR